MYYHPPCQECREGRRSIDVNHSSQALIYFSGSGSGSGFRVPGFIFFHTPSKNAVVRSEVKLDFTITAEILARSLANFYRQYADRHMNLKFVRRVSE